MSKVGLEWYKREPQAYLGGVQGMSCREHAVYAIVLDLIYANGGQINNDPRWIAGWISDMGAAAVRKAISMLVERGKLQVEGGYLTQKRAKNEAKTKENQRKTAEKLGKKGGEISAKMRAAAKENKGLGQGYPQNEIQADKRRKEKRDTSPSSLRSEEEGGKPPKIDATKFMFDKGIALLAEAGVTERNARSLLGKWKKDHGEGNVLSALGRAQREGAIDPVAFIEGCFKAGMSSAKAGGGILMVTPEGERKVVKPDHNGHVPMHYQVLGWRRVSG